ncbi:bifunctional UDP-N-acetylglucosamine diphosphorylase/glucosamine-1-phosphate N-acetyltransferase GlmU [Acetobacter cerevisiae]|uniref:Bifunctional protein GlmU n=1 Tax=Acetobacter cerevisiae TaxID=178900 RepID=A0A149Q4L3_9PROT|nr:bifunctional UDP-N-acetylglucosamine diphosphorylase/glucosamine-1-phosphate N-acetyltransferase GlmU [Acetobacter cerevisiae]KXU92259.1 bifunctional N-acetylglucosamine-1-phosphate uridyltransferase/glucosamine-1-phosphate acetyltransferase [Acetobacter cerevisiae]GBQ04515.1 bifunctional N-acetylglucosamine-1-phosphate uridyltransferase [Acetobacter cerevisiae DSM 14362]
MTSSPASRPATAVLLAAGLGTRMKSSRPKAMQRLAGRPMLAHLIASAAEVFDRLVVVIGPEMGDVAELAAPYPVVIQHERLGTAHAALQAEAYFGEGDVAVLYADNPLISADTLSRLLEARHAPDVGLALLAMRPAEPGRYGRVIAQDGLVERIVEWADATPEERAVDLCNAGVLCADATTFRRWLHSVKNDNAKGEFYLTDVVDCAVADGVRVHAVEAAEDELRGINSRMELAEAEAALQDRLRQKAMENGVTLVAPETVFFCADTTLAPDVLVEPHVVFGPGVTVESGAEIRAFSHLEGCTVQADAIIGPYARLRPGTTIGTAARVGNFVEVKNTTLGDGAKANHLTYLGDASVGTGSNVGAGTITCNYDGFFKHKTTIGDRVFVGSNSILVAPVSIGTNALIAAGSVITKDVPEDAMAFGRPRQENKPELGKRFKETLKARKENG